MIGQKTSREVLAVACLVLTFATSASPAEPQGTNDVTIATVPQRTVVFVDHVGPYWGIATKLQAVRNYMQAHKLSGPLLIRYAADPTRAGGSSIAMKIGFALDGEHTPVAPFKKETWISELMATTPVPAGSAGLVEACRSIRAWSKFRDFAPTGSVIEVFEESAGGETDRTRTTIQMAIRPGKQAQPESDKDVAEQRAIPKQPAEQSHGQSQSAPPKPAVPAKAKPIQDRTIRLAPDPPVAEQAPATPIKPSPPSSRPRKATPKDRPDVPRPNIRPVPDKRIPTKASIDPVTKAPAPKPQAGKVRPETETETLAKRLIPPARSTDSQSRAWLGEVVLRVRAISRGTNRIHREEGSAIIGLADAVSNRYARLYGQSNLESKARPQAAGPANTALSKRRRAITRDLDQFMAILGARTLSISETEIRFRRIIHQAADIADAMLLSNEGFE